MDSTSTVHVQYSRKPKNRHLTLAKNSSSRLRTLISIFSISFGIWIISLLSFYPPIPGWITPKFPYEVNTEVITVFLISAAIAAGTSLLLGLTFLTVKKLDNLTHFS